ncbi:MAG: SpoIIE family protein phosphatase [Ignavibacteriaceae bacterium]|nr:SpoIIE family protein phosphatase [Ignavibacteriaceae bacterium]
MKLKLMVVDDEPDLETLIRQRFRRQIRDESFEFVFAHNGLEALARLIEHPDIGIILTDINMPEMDGLTLLSKIAELNNPALKTVVVSAYGDMENIRTAMNRGAFDFITKPIDFGDLEITINKTLQQLTILKQSLEEHDQLIALKQDLNTAKIIQQAILPKVFPPYPDRKDFDVFGSMTAAKDIGGDFFDFFMIDDKNFGFVIGDVSGKGIPAAIFMAVSRTLLRATALKGLSPNECLVHVNNLLCSESVSSMFVTVFYGILNTETGLVTYANGGHNPPYLIKADGTVELIPMTGGIALGVMEEMPYNFKSFTLNPGETVFLFTDGVTEAMDSKEDLFSEERLIERLTSSNSKSISDITKDVIDSVFEYSKDVPQSDDITVLTFRYFGR